MKTSMVQLMVGVLMVGVFSQCAPVSMNKVSTRIENGELLEAKALADSAVTLEEMKNKGKTWFHRGKVYQAIAQDSTQSYPEVENPVKTAVESFKKTKELEDEGSMYYTQSDQRMEQLWSVNLNEGAKLYQSNNYEGAIDYFEKAQLAKPGDTTAYLYAGIAAQQVENMQKAEENYEYLVNELDYEDEQIYNSLIYIETQINNNADEALKYISKARELFPDNEDYIKQEINILINQGRYEEANDRTAEAIESDPDNPVLYYNRGVLFEQMDQGEKAVENYQKAIELDSEYYDAVFNLGAYYYNKAANILKPINQMDLEEYEEKGEEIEKEAAKWFEKALPHLKKAIDLQPDNTKALQTLSTVYERLGMEDEAEEIKQKLSNMGN